MKNCVIMRHWVFDFDGTLVDSEGFFHECMSFALAPFGIKVAPDFMEHIRHKHPKRIFEDFLTPDQNEVAFARLAEVSQGILDQIRLFPGMLQVLETLDRQGASLSLWTGRDRESAEKILRINGLENQFDRITTGTCVEVNKPAPDGLLDIINFHNAQSDEVVMVGDHHHDIIPANQLGVVSVHARWKTNPHELAGLVQPSHQFDCTGTFHQWLLSQIKSIKE